MEGYVLCYTGRTSVSIVPDPDGWAGFLWIWYVRHSQNRKALFFFSDLSYARYVLDGNTNEELCNRWMQLSAFFPFYRNHNILGALPQEPYRWASVAEASRVAMDVRYRMLPYWVCVVYPHVY